jgi:hypothetical protein
VRPKEDGVDETSKRGFLAIRKRQRRSLAKLNKVKGYNVSVSEGEEWFDEQQ